MGYPMIASRTDVAPPVPSLPAGLISKIGAPVSASKFRPPPIKIPTTSNATFLDKFRSGGKDSKAEEEAAKLKAKGKKAKAQEIAEEAQSRLVQNQQAFYAQYPEEELTLNITSAKSIEMATARGETTPSPPQARSLNGRIPVPSIDDLRFDKLFPDAPLSPSVRTPSVRSSTHRRATSFNESSSPKPTSAPMFEAPLEARRATVYDASPRPSSTHTVGSRKRAPLKTPAPARLDSPPATPTSIGTSSSTPISDAFYSPLTPRFPRDRLPAHISNAPLDRTSIAVGVRDSGGERDVARVAFGPEGVAVLLQSAHRHEEVEVTLSSSQKYDNDGSPITQWEIKILPKTQPMSDNPALRPRFSAYRLANLPPVRSGGSAPTSPKSATLDADGAFVPPPLPDTDFLDQPYSRQRQASTTQSDVTASSISSESSAGPTTPRRGSRFTSGDSDDGAVGVSRKSSVAGSSRGTPGKSRFLDYHPQTVDSISIDNDENDAIVVGRRKSSGGRSARLGAPGSGPVEVLLPSPSFSDGSFASNRELPALRTSYRSSRSSRKSRTSKPDPLQSPDLGDRSADASTDASDDEDEHGVTQRDIDMAVARQRSRAVSKWSDTDGGDSEEEPIHDPNYTSWSNVPDASDESM
ncbi:hypothetical protein RQP46_005720 [Phenoliferia psychrophenolica]